MARQLAPKNVTKKATYEVPLPTKPKSRARTKTTQAVVDHRERKVGGRKAGPNKKQTYYLSPEQRQEVVKLSGTLTQAAIAAKFGITQPAVSYIVKQARKASGEKTHEPVSSKQTTEEAKNLSSALREDD